MYQAQLGILPRQYHTLAQLVQDHENAKCNTEQLEVELIKMSEIRDGFRKRYLEEREARKDLERDVRRIKKECKAKIDVLLTTASTNKNGGGPNYDEDRYDKYHPEEDRHRGDHTERYSEQQQNTTYRNSDQDGEWSQENSAGRSHGRSGAKMNAYVDNNDLQEYQGTQRSHVSPFNLDRKGTINENSENDDVSQDKHEYIINANAGRNGGEKYFTQTNEQNNYTFNSNHSDYSYPQVQHKKRKYTYKGGTKTGGLNTEGIQSNISIV